MDNFQELLYAPVYSEKTCKFLEQQFSRLQGECYLDHAGATLYADNQIKLSLNNLLSSLYTNPHSSGLNANLTEETIDNIRYRVLEHFHTTQDEYSIIFTSGATASLKLVAETFNFHNGCNEKNDGQFVHIQDNHTSVLGMRDLVVQKGAKVTAINYDETFTILELNCNENHSFQNDKANSLFVYSAQCNFSGFKYPLSWIKNVKNGCLNSYVQSDSNWFVMLDAASFAATNDLNLSVFKPDFVCISFYKMFGYPTGLGALLVRNESAEVLKKVYYGGGTVDVVLSSKMQHVKKNSLHQRFEDGTISFLSIASLQHGLKILSDISMSQISAHVFSLARYLHHSLLSLYHHNRQPLVKLYCDSDYENINLQGGIISFNVFRANGEYVGYTEVLNMAALYKIHLRTGCFCNPGACQRHLQLSNDDILNNYNSGYTCGGSTDLINGYPTGAVRVSFGYMSTEKDIQSLLLMLVKCFISGPEIIKYPLWSSDFKLKLKLNLENLKSVVISDDYKINDTDSKNTKINKFIKIRNETVELMNNNTIASNVYKKNQTSFELFKVFLYPIKSCGSYEVKNSWKLTSKGLQYDREWMIVTSTGVCLTQKQETKLCMIKPIIDLNRNELVLHYPNMPSICVPLNIASYEIVNGKLCKGKICGHKVEGIDCGSEVSEWLSLALGRPNLRLIRHSESSEKKKINKPELSFASQSQYLLINSASISWLANEIPNDFDCIKDTMLPRFRGNFVIKGCAPFEEINWKSVKIGNCTFQVEGVCTRCQMICIDQTTGIKTVEPLRTLAEKFHGKLRFGIYLVKSGIEDDLKIGDKVYCN
ncbi:molybdenum cofactor sulfurase 3 [Trichogramma pretiosum]|uniref:molybdenum cofactor sulfurase 3 n=1 Tax=Trichogramma pretiosum TaxID=7493 RepID=UPI0006C93C68|nr:molybdenum cofactor sulfurase 3 [Trichogramma pretiosum]